jgi:hypothetical protein
MITFNVVKEQDGWAIQVGRRMTTPFRSRDLAVREANCLADAIRSHGECTEVIVAAADPNEPPEGIMDVSSSRLKTLFWGRWLRGRWVGPQ